jgi:hypothetical protein
MASQSFSNDTGYMNAYRCGALRNIKTWRCALAVLMNRIRDSVRHQEKVRHRPHESFNRGSASFDVITPSSESMALSESLALRLVGGRVQALGGVSPQGEIRGSKPRRSTWDSASEVGGGDSIVCGTSHGV